MSYSDLFPLNVMINLDSRPDRWKESTEIELPKAGIERIARCPGLVYHVSDNSWINGAIGCLASHVQCLKYALENKSNITIFEDDVKFTDNAKEIMDLASDELADMQWDMIYWGGNILKPFYQKTNHLAQLFHCQSTVAYSVHWDFVEKLLNYIPQNTFQYPIDVIYADHVIPNNNCFITVPMIATQREGKSDIEGMVVNYEKYLWKRYDDNFVPLTKY
jgi:GR25 family glycosyltransferase involved in LPS biosynthesis